MSKWIELKSIADLTVGFVGTMAKHYKNDGIPFLRSLNIKPFKIVNDDIKYISQEFCKKISKSILHEGDVVIVRTGLPGTCCVVPAEYDGCNCSDVVIVHPNTELVNAHYLATFINIWGQRQIHNNKVGAIQQHFNVRSAEEMLIYLPEKEEQEKIAGVVVAINEKIESNNTICSELEAMAKTLYDYWFAQFDFPDENGKPYRTFGGEMVWNEQLKREIPKGWKVTNIGNLTTVVTGKEDANFSSPNGKYKFFTCSQEALLCDTPAFSGQAVLIAGNGDFNVKHYSGEFNAYQRTYVLIPENQVYYGAMYISAKNQIQAFKNGSNGSIVKFITKGDVENIPFILPNDDSIFHQINKLIEKIELCERENEELTKLRDWLLPMLMNGQATVVDAEEKAGKVIPYTPQTVEVRQAARNFGDTKTDDTADLVQAYLRRKQHDSKTQKRS